MIRHIAVTGGTGFVGQAVCEQLVERSGGAGGRIVVPTRRIRRGQAVQSLPTVERVQADVHDERALARVLAGCDAVVHLVAILHGSEADFQRVHVELPRKLVAACRAAGVRRIVHVSALGVAPDAPSRYLRSKAAGERVLLESGLDVTVLRPSVIFGARDRFLNLFAQLQALAPFMPLGGADARFQPVWVEDVAAAAVRCLDRPQTIGQTIECAGPDVLTLAQLVRLAGRLAGCERPVLPLPEAIAPSGRADGTAARRAADVARQRRLDARAQRGHRHAARPGHAGHHAGAGGGGGRRLPGRAQRARALPALARAPGLKAHVPPAWTPRRRPDTLPPG
jgi:NADH dehydrogenase